MIALRSYQSDTPALPPRCSPPPPPHSRKLTIPLIDVNTRDRTYLCGSTRDKSETKGEKKGGTTYFFLLLVEVEELSCRPSSCIQKQHKVSREQGGDRKKNKATTISNSSSHKILQFFHCCLSKLWIILKKKIQQTFTASSQNVKCPFCTYEASK